MTVTIDTSGVRDAEQYFTIFPRQAASALSMAINDTARGTALKAARRDITASTAFPAGYLNDQRLSIVEFSTPTKLKAVIEGRDRPTSLARFASADLRTITVRPGQTESIRRPFRVTLNSGNIGLAMRLRPGETLHNVRAFSPVYFGKNLDLVLLYGPSVDQAFQTVLPGLRAEVTTALEAEFLRQFFRLVSGNA